MWYKTRIALYILKTSQRRIYAAVTIAASLPQHQVQQGQLCCWQGEKMHRQPQPRVPTIDTAKDVTTPNHPQKDPHPRRAFAQPRTLSQHIGLWDHKRPESLSPLAWHYYSIFPSKRGYRSKDGIYLFCYCLDFPSPFFLFSVHFATCTEVWTD